MLRGLGGVVGESRSVGAMDLAAAEEPELGRSVNAASQEPSVTRGARAIDKHKRPAGHRSAARVTPPTVL